MNIFFTADLHFHHKNVILFESRPFKDIEEMNDTLVKNWNNRVSNKDDIYILGDFSFGNTEQTLELLNNLNGNKYLIKGNHDHVVKNKEVASKFVWIKDYHKLKTNNQKIILFHYPIQVFDSQHYGAIHLYGHVHSNKDNHHPMLNSIENSYNVGVDVNSYEPVSINEILEKLRSELS